MKIINSIILTTLVLSLASCSMNTTIAKEEIKEETKEYSIDVTESFIDCKDGDNYRLIEPVNNRMGEIIDSLMYEIKSDAITASSRRRQTVVKYKLISRDTIFKVTMDIISTRIKADIYDKSGHDTKFYGVNYRPETGRYIPIDNIFDMSKTESINVAINKHFTDRGKATKEPTIETASVVNISDDSAIFSYNSGVLGNGCGAVVIEVPIKELKDYLKI